MIQVTGNHTPCPVVRWAMSEGRRRWSRSRLGWRNDI